MVVLRAAASAVLVASAVAACTPEAPAPTVTPPPPTEVRDDTAPLTARFPALGTPVSARWVSWNSAGGGDSRVPGPTVYWLDAVVELTPAAAAALVERYRPTEHPATPEVAELLRPELPPGPYLTGDALNRALTTSQWLSRAYLDAAAHELVISSTSA